jgi:hypothetical protein
LQLRSLGALFHFTAAVLIFVDFTPAGAYPLMVGEVTSPGKIRVCEVELKMAGVLSWTLFSGDRLEVTETPALVILNNGTRLIIDPKTAVSLERRSSLTVNILSGTVFASCAANCETVIEAKGQIFSIAARQTLQVSRHGAVVIASRPVPIPVFSFPSFLLFRLFPYQTGIHQPEDELQR